MKKILIVLSSLLILQACNNGGEGGVVDDGMKEVGDTNGGLPDTSSIDPSKDTLTGDDRVDTWKRDSSQNKKQ